MQLSLESTIARTGALISGVRRQINEAVHKKLTLKGMPEVQGRKAGPHAHCKIRTQVP